MNSSASSFVGHVVGVAFEHDYCFNPDEQGIQIAYMTLCTICANKDEQLLASMLRCIDMHSSKHAIDSLIRFVETCKGVPPFVLSGIVRFMKARDKYEEALARMLSASAAHKGTAVLILRYAAVEVRGRSAVGEEGGEGEGGGGLHV